MLSLSSSVLELPGVGAQTAKQLHHLDIRSIQDLLYHLPFRYDDLSKTPPIASVQPEEEVTLYATVTQLAQVTTRRGKSMLVGKITDDSGSLDVLWFNQPYLLYSLRKGTQRAFSGKVSLYKGKRTLVNPITENTDEKGIHTGRLVPIYPVSSEIKVRQLRTLIASAFKQCSITDPFEAKFLRIHHLLPLQTALQQLHFPEKIQQVSIARRRLAFEEVFLLLLTAQKKKKVRQHRQARSQLHVSAQQQRQFQRALPFTLSPSQLQTLLDLALDLVQPYPADRLIQGEVGSGKTVLAAFALYIATQQQQSGLFLAPTQILAKQHAQTLRSLLGEKSRVELVIAGSTPELQLGTIYVGTHALLAKKYAGKAAVVVIDEEHRFGVEQRNTFLSGRIHPHLITMTATPIPRTSAQTVLADRDVSYLEEVPGKKKDIKTWVVPQAKRDSAYNWLLQHAREGHQIFIVCPFIQESESNETVKAAESEYKTLQSIFPTLKLGLLHGKVPATKKEQVLQAFHDKKLDILVATPVIEVGIDIPGASIMVIENAERFGLAQLHQLRGRVGRRGQPAFCLLFCSNQEAEQRLKPLEKLTNGSELAELDLHQRGAGELFGIKQSGWSGLRFASWFDQQLIQDCRQAVLNSR